jgi:DNA-binding LacI/PurR family transcriptional regulator
VKGGIIMTTRSEADIINTERQRMADAMTKELQKLGVQVHIAHFTGDSSYPTEYNLNYQGIRATGPTFDLALLSWIEKMLEVATKPAGRYQAVEAALKVLAGGILNLRTELLVVKAEVVKDSEQGRRIQDD